jgi:hypothetical protein
MLPETIPGPALRSDQGFGTLQADFPARLGPSHLFWPAPSQHLTSRNQGPEFSASDFQRPCLAPEVSCPLSPIPVNCWGVGYRHLLSRFSCVDRGVTGVKGPEQHRLSGLSCVCEPSWLNHLRPRPLCRKKLD